MIVEIPECPDLHHTTEGAQVLQQLKMNCTKYNIDKVYMQLQLFSIIQERHVYQVIKKTKIHASSLRTASEKWNTNLWKL